jgi:hypothetical protein
MLEYLGTLLGMHQIDGIISSAEAAEKQPKQVQSAPPTKEQLCSFKDIDKIRECLDRKFKDDKDPRPEMWDKDWINKP